MIYKINMGESVEITAHQTFCEWLLISADWILWKCFFFFFFFTGSRAQIKVSGHQYQWLASGYDLEIGQFLEVVCMVVIW